jgi:hypothetical protein
VRDLRGHRRELVVVDDRPVGDDKARRAGLCLEVVFEQREEVGVHVGWTPGARTFGASLPPEGCTRDSALGREFVLPLGLKTGGAPRGTLAGGLFHNVDVLREPRAPPPNSSVSAY